MASEAAALRPKPEDAPVITTCLSPVDLPEDLAGLAPSATADTLVAPALAPAALRTDALGATGATWVVLATAFDWSLADAAIGVLLARAGVVALTALMRFAWDACILALGSARNGVVGRLGGSGGAV